MPFQAARQHSHNVAKMATARPLLQITFAPASHALRDRRAQRQAWWWLTTGSNDTCISTRHSYGRVRTSCKVNKASDDKVASDVCYDMHALDMCNAGTAVELQITSMNAIVPLPTGEKGHPGHVVPSFFRTSSEIPHFM